MVASAFVGNAEIDGINYNIVTEAKTAEVIAKSSGSYSGDIVIPATVEYDGVVCDVTSIGSKAFYNCSGLTSVTIGSGVTSIGDYAFDGCSGLTSIDIPNSVTSIGGGAFWGCSGLTSITIGNSVTSIGSSAFLYCTGLTSVTIPNSVTSIGDWSFSECSGLTSVTIGNSVTSIGDYAFQKCTSLTSIDIPNSVTSIGMSAFSGCSGLTSITIPNSVTSIWYAFKNCSGLTSITIPNSVTSIGDDTFYNCSGLTSITIGSGVTWIGEKAFASCSELTDVYCYAEKVPSTNSEAFKDSYIEYATLHVPAASVSLYQQKTPWSGFKSIVALNGETPDVPEVKKCANPTITYTNGKIVFNCETEDVEYISEIKATDATKYYDGEIVPTNKYIVTVYATKTGYDNSDVVTGEITIGGGTGIKGDVNEDGSVDVEDVVDVVNIILEK